MLLGGVQIPADVHLVGHSDADAVCHAITDAVLGAAALGDIGELFPDSDPANAGRSSIHMLQAAMERVRAAGYEVGNVDVTVIAQKPRIGPHREAIRQTLSTAISVDESRVFVKGKTNESLGWIGREEGLAVIAVATLVRRGSSPSGSA
jgi:2-C-methyl-D-erythritol 2,4-cyclodiphosphate synthase